MIEMGPWRCAAARSNGLTVWRSPTAAPLPVGRGLVPPASFRAGKRFSRCETERGRRGRPLSAYCRVTLRPVSRPSRFEDYRFLGDKRSQVVYDLDLVDDAGLGDVIDELMASEQFTAFGPDTLAEARNRGYRPHRSIRASAATVDE